ncbi:MAG: ABC transporter permease subunit [Candidatus Latescibacteria bacterium]|nr:ABC transporter permease subunit [Candidatus Latescibacterota bacterium]NIM66281.1 ABC transporter permease subunit [Candidatus Latescibacterota bacterium]NIO02762.1 ABC transporter permease subunit [Candidatus Latescibacterota bacterium]NIO29897.1 ABC transporter permease subunit [Candidatus Latescibacterota bacterium]NIO57511.1 ABC transporter permease subunit [Candidatus Latescibacterota bacterium]
MLTYTLRRLAYLIPTLLGITFVTFIIISLAPGDPVALMQSGEMSARISPAAYNQMLKHYGLDKPVHVRYVIWLKRLITLDFGTSFLDDRQVIEKILERLPATLILNVTALLFALLLSIPLGLYSAVRQYSLFDKVNGVILYMLYSLPDFWVALILIMFLGVKLKLLPFFGIESMNAKEMGFFAYFWDRILHMVMPTFCLTYGSLAFLSRFVRGSTLEVIRKDYIRTARAKGLEEKAVLYKHVFKNTLIPILTLLGILLPTIISGSVILEYIFSWPGIGALFFGAVLSRDYPTVMGLSFITAVMVLLSTLVADLLYAWADPRITYD